MLLILGMAVGCRTTEWQEPPSYAQHIDLSKIQFRTNSTDGTIAVSKNTQGQSFVELEMKDLGLGVSLDRKLASREIGEVSIVVLDHQGRELGRSPNPKFGNQSIVIREDVEPGKTLVVYLEFVYLQVFSSVACSTRDSQCNADSPSEFPKAVTHPKDQDSSWDMCQDFPKCRALLRDQVARANESGQSAPYPPSRYNYREWSLVSHPSVFPIGRVEGRELTKKRGDEDSLEAPVEPKPTSKEKTKFPRLRLPKPRD